MTTREAAEEHPAQGDTELLIAALNHSLGWYEARIDRGLQVINYFIVASAVLATAYVSAVSGRHYAVGVVIALAGTALTTLAFVVGRQQRRYAADAEPGLAELQRRVARRLEINSFCIVQPEEKIHKDLSVKVAFGFAVALSIGSLLYALIH